jgi:hypothetical protein
MIEKHDLKANSFITFPTINFLVLLILVDVIVGFKGALNLPAIIENGFPDQSLMEIIINSPSVKMDLFIPVLICTILTLIITVLSVELLIKKEVK